MKTDSLSDAIEKANVRITFGLQPHHIEKIEAELKRWNEMPPLSDGAKADPKYIKYVWEKLGKKLGWCPFTLALYYFEHLDVEKQKKMITKQQFKDAMVIVESYCSQLHKTHVGSAVNEVGCRVKLSSWGLELQGNKKKKLVGAVLDFDQWMHYENDGIVTVKWDGISKPDTMHVSQIEALK